MIFIWVTLTNILFQESLLTSISFSYILFFGFLQAMIVRGFRGDSSTHKLYFLSDSSIRMEDVVSLLCLIGIIGAAVLSEYLLVWNAFSPSLGKSLILSMHPQEFNWTFSLLVISVFLTLLIWLAGVFISSRLPHFLCNGFKLLVAIYFYCHILFFSCKS